MVSQSHQSVNQSIEIVTSDKQKLLMLKHCSHFGDSPTPKNSVLAHAPGSQTAHATDSGADPVRNLTRAQPKARGCGYMGVALSMDSYKHDLVDTTQSSA